MSQHGFFSLEFSSYICMEMQECVPLIGSIIFKMPFCSLYCKGTFVCKDQAFDKDALLYQEKKRYVFLC